MALGQKNEVKVAIENYTHLIIGERKIGKSTLIADIATTLSSLDDLLVISVGDEDGFHAIDGLIFENPMKWNEFVKIVDELVLNPDEQPFKFVCIDTIDELINLGIAEVLRLHKLEKGDVPKSINDAFGGYGRGKAKLFEMINGQVSRLKKSKYGLFEIGHNKVRELKDKGTGDQYNVLTSNLTNDYFDVFAYKADIVCNIVTEKEMGENNNLQDIKRYMYFRSDGFIDAGSRFAELPNRVPYGAEQYIEAVKDGIKNSLKKPIGDKEMATKRQQEIDAKEKAAKEQIKVANAEAEEEEMQEQIKEFVKYIQTNIKKATSETQAMLKERIISDIGSLKEVPVDKIAELSEIKNLLEQDLLSA